MTIDNQSKYPNQNSDSIFQQSHLEHLCHHLIINQTVAFPFGKNSKSKLKIKGKVCYSSYSPRYYKTHLKPSFDVFFCLHLPQTSPRIGHNLSNLIQPLSARESFVEFTHCLTPRQSPVKQLLLSFSLFYTKSYKSESGTQLDWIKKTKILYLLLIAKWSLPLYSAKKINHILGVFTEQHQTIKRVHINLLSRHTSV